MLSETAWQKWYRVHKEEFNASRRKRYADDKEYRESQIKHAREQRRRKVIEEKAEKDRKQASLHGWVVTLSVVADKVNRTPETVKYWEKKKWIPPVTRIGGVRVFSDHQVMLLKILSEFLSAHPNKMKVETRKEFEVLVKNIAESWGDVCQ